MQTREARHRRPAQAAGRRRGRQRPPHGGRDRHDRLGDDHDLGGAAHHMTRGMRVLLLRQPGDDGAGGCRTPTRPRSPSPTGRSSPSSATAGSPCSAASSSRPSSTSCRSSVIVIKNNVLGQIKWEQMVFLGNPEYGVELQPIDFVKFAEACGGAGFRCDDARRGRAGDGRGLRDERACAGRGRRRSVSSRRCPPRRRSSRGSGSPSRSSAASRTPAGSPRRSSATRSTNCSEGRPARRPRGPHDDPTRRVGYSSQELGHRAGHPFSGSRWSVLR